jgi:carbonic anhydrase/acetyltransferase-like protein (isoleucine patch superfamily)
MKHSGPDITITNPAYIDETARIFGKVTVAEGASLWPYAVVRAENREVRIGRYTNIQDHAMIHIGYNSPTIIGDYCSITHHCTIHGCTIGNNCLVGINATIMDDCVIGDNCIIAGGAFLKEGTIVPDNSIVMGMPGKVVRTKNSFRENRRNAMSYYRNALGYAQGEHRTWAKGGANDDDEDIQAAFNALYGDS